MYARFRNRALALLLGVGGLGCDSGDLEPTRPESSGGSGKADGNSDSVAPLRGLDSREYKVMLDPDLFWGNDADAVVTQYWADLASTAQALGHDPEGSPGDDLRERGVAFFDVEGCQLRTMGYALRHRTQGYDAEATLKFRSNDLLLAGTTHLDIEAEKAETKFEEDVVPPFSSKYSLSAKVEVDPGWTPASMDDLRELVSSNALDDLDGSLQLVGDTVYIEHAYKGAEIDLGPVDAKVAITLWWTPDQPWQPVVGEASFTLDTQDDLDPETIQHAGALFEAMVGLDGWVAPEATTKTALVYERGADLCE
jgi:hypothetical protein